MGQNVLVLTANNLSVGRRDFCYPYMRHRLTKSLAPQASGAWRLTFVLVLVDTFFFFITYQSMSRRILVAIV